MSDVYYKNVLFSLLEYIIKKLKRSCLLKKLTPGDPFINKV